MSELHRICVIPIARVDGRGMTVLRKLKRQGAVPLGYGADIAAGSLAIANWLNEQGAVGVEEHQVIPIEFVTSKESVDKVEALNRTGQYRVRYVSKLPLTSWRRVKVSTQDYEALADREDNIGLQLGDVWSELWENQNTSIGVPLALIWNYLYDRAKQTVE